MATINVHKAKGGSITYRVRVRRKGERIQTASFPTRKAAQRWATMIEGQMIEGRHFPVNKPTCTLTELLERYTAEILPADLVQQAAVPFEQTTVVKKRVHTRSGVDQLTVF